MEPEEAARGTVGDLPDGRAAPQSGDNGDAWPDVSPGLSSADLERLAETLERLRCIGVLVEVHATEIVTVKSLVLERSLGAWWVCTKEEGGRNRRVLGNPDGGFRTAVEAWRWASNREADKSADAED